MRETHSYHVSKVFQSRITSSTTLRGRPQTKLSHIMMKKFSNFIQVSIPGWSVLKCAGVQIHIWINLFHYYNCFKCNNWIEYLKSYMRRILAILIHFRGGTKSRHSLPTGRGIQTVQNQSIDQPSQFGITLESSWMFDFESSQKQFHNKSMSEII